MASTITAYDHFWKLVTTGGLDLDASPIWVRLVTSGYVFNAAHTLWDNTLTDNTNPKHHEASAGAGYTTGGIQLASPVVTNANIKYNNLTWNSLTKTFRFGIGVAVGTYGGVVNPLLFCFLPDSTPADTISTGSNYTIQWNSTDGLFYRAL